MASTIDSQLDFIPDFREWEAEFKRLRDSRVEGYHYGSDVNLAPIGAYEIFEGQARFAQIQYLFFASGKKLEWSDVHKRGMLDNVYGEAFRFYLKLTENHFPVRIDDPSVALFLLVCDMAINPGEGFPFQPKSYSIFIEDVDPGLRFCFLCRAVANSCKQVKSAIRNYSKEEYVEVSAVLARAILVKEPHAVATRVVEWSERYEQLEILMAEYENHDYGPLNNPVRLLFSYFIAFCIDKSKSPQFFCWPGAWMAGERCSEDSSEIFERHKALFIDKEDDGGIFASKRNGRDEASLQNSFQSFYASNITYDMTRQWIAMEGPFRYDYRWLTTKEDYETMKAFVDTNFHHFYSVHPDEFETV